uniref:RNA-binding protein 15 isoform X1 n=2 Tax=Ciona intestinalis TaxID=7719 RepID=UPI000180CFFA|nr:RNA-binding protein 15 isoform X1 [Ciona intestinalis]|eukprot:XP_018673252.1 RNA-binding protein 15 isoform X1 [Ciona intestinalis]
MVMKRQGDRDRDSPTRMKRNRGRSPNRRSFRELNSPEYRDRDARFSSRDARRNISQNRRRSPYPSPKYSPPVEASRGRRGRDYEEYYTTLMVHNFSSKLNSDDIEESLYYEFKKFGDVSIRVTTDSYGERVAYATFRSSDSARSCKNAKGHLVMHERRLSIDVVHDEPSNRYSPRRTPPREKVRSPPRQRSLPRSPVRRQSPPPKKSYQRGRSPPPRERYPARERPSYRETRDRFSPQERSRGRHDSPDLVSPRERRNYSPDNRISPRERSFTPRSSSREKSRTPVEKQRVESKEKNSSNHDSNTDEKSKKSTENTPQYNQANQNQNNMPPGGMGFGMQMGMPPFHDPNYFPPGSFMDKAIPPEDDPYATRTLFVGNLEPDVSNYDIRKVFEVYGRVDDIDVKRAARGLGSYCFVRFSNLDQAYKAKISLNGKAVIKNVVRVGYGKVMLSSKVWVGGLGSWTTLSDLEREFDRFGAIRRIDFRKGDTSSAILYETIDAAQAACNQMRGFLMPNAETRLRMDFLDPEPGMPGYEAFSEWGRHDNKNYESNSQKYNNSNDRYQDKRNNSRYRGRNIFVDEKPNKSRSRRSRSPRRRSRDRSRGSSNHRGNETVSKDIKESEMTAMQYKHFHAKSCYSLHDLCQCFDPPCWQGGFVLKNIAFPVLFFFLDGDMGVFNTTTADPNSPTGRQTMFHLTQRLKLNEEKTKEVSRRMKSCVNRTCLIVAVPGVPENLNTTGTISGPVPTQHKPLRGLVKYFKEKEAAGIVSVPAITTDTPKEWDKTSYKDRPLSGVLHLFPPGPFAHEQLLRIGPNLQPQYFADDYMVALLVKGPKGSLV